jgi:hypothetical protein
MGVKYYRDVQITSPREIWTATTTSEIQFVDGDYGSNGNAGWSPKKAVASITQAVTNVTTKRQAVIYVRPKGNSTTSGQSYYTDNVTVPLTTPNLAIIGAGASSARPFLGVDIKATTSTSPVITVNGSGLYLEGMRLAGTGQNATDGIAIILGVSSASAAGCTGLQIVNCRLDNAKTGGAISLDSPNHVEVVGCSFDECAVGITTVLSYGGVASRGFKIMDCDFGGRNSTRDMDIYISQSGTGAGNSIAGYEIYKCRFLDELPAKGGNNKFIKIANGDQGLISFCSFPVNPGANHIDTFGAAGNQCVIPTTWKMVSCRGTSDLDFIHPEAA